MVADALSDAMVPVPDHGRLFRSTDRVRLGDVSPHGRLRLDALVRLLQDVSDDDVRDAAFEGNWVVRRLAIQVDRFPEYGEDLELTTFCSGLGSHWAERRVEVHGDRGGTASASTIWVLVDPTTAAPARLGEEFLVIYGPSAGDRRVRARLHHDGPPTDGERGAWRFRFVDYDVLRHVNNAAYWVVVEEHLARRRDLRAPMRAEIEFRAAVERDDDTEIVVLDEDRALKVWIVSGRGVHASLTVSSP